MATLFSSSVSFTAFTGVAGQVTIISLRLFEVGGRAVLNPRSSQNVYLWQLNIISQARAYNFELQMFSVGDYCISSVLMGYNDVNF